MVLLAHILSIFSMTTPLLILFIFKPRLKASFIVWQGKGSKMGSQNKATASMIAFIIQTGLGSKRSNYCKRFNLTISEYPHRIKLKSISFWIWLPASERELINVVLKLHLCLLLLVRLYKPLLLFGLYAPRAGNGQKGFTKLVNMRGQGSSNKNYLNILRVEDLKKRGRPSIPRSGNKKARIPQQEIGA